MYIYIYLPTFDIYIYTYITYMGCCSLPSLPEGALYGQQIYVVWGRLSHRKFTSAWVSYGGYILIDFCQFYDPSGVTDLSVGETASDGVSPSRTSRGAGSQQPQSSSHSSHHRFHFFNEPTHTSSSSLQPALEWSFGFPTDLAFKKAADRAFIDSSMHRQRPKTVPFGNSNDEGMDQNCI